MIKTPSGVAVGLVALGLICQEVGASVTVMLFGEVGPLGMVMLRLVFTALILVLIRRPSLLEIGGIALVVIASAGAV